MKKKKEEIKEEKVEEQTQLVLIENDPLEEYISRRLTKMQLGDLRRIKHLTQKQVADMTGLSVQCISDIESEDSGNPTLKSLNRYLECLGFEIAFQKKKI